MRHIVCPLIALILVVGLAGCSPSAPEPTPEEATRIHAGEPAPEFHGQLMDGTQFSLSDQQGKVVVLAFFATWCPPCREELPHLESEVWQRFQGPNFSMIAIAREHEASELGEFVTQMGMTFPVLPDPDRAIFSLFADAFIPRTIVIDPTGQVIYHGTDFNSEEFSQMVELIETTVAETSPAISEPDLDSTADLPTADG